MTDPADSWDPVHPDTLGGAELDAVLSMFRDVDWADRVAVERRVADLRALDSDSG